MITKSSRASFVSHIQEMADLLSTDYFSAELRPSRIRRDTTDLNKVLKQMSGSCLLTVLQNGKARDE